METSDRWQDRTERDRGGRCGGERGEDWTRKRREMGEKLGTNEG